MMNPEIKKIWIEALRSGEYEQGRYCLENIEGQFCCLGVLSHIAWKNGICERSFTNNYMIKYDDSKGFLPPSVMKWAGLKERSPIIKEKTLSLYNDSESSFSEIADLIEKYL